MKWLTVLATGAGCGAILSAILGNFEYGQTIGLGAIALAILSLHEK